MAFTGSYVCTSFITNLLTGVINTGTDTFRMALYDSTATLTAATTAYTASGELAAAGGYTTGGEVATVTITTASTPQGTVVIFSFPAITWAAATFTTRGAMLYDDTAVGNPSIMIIDFGLDIVKAGTDFTITPGAATANAAPIVFSVVLNTP